jgi:hypothetical protein
MVILVRDALVRHGAYFEAGRRRLTFPKLRIPGPAAQTRVVSMAEIRLGSGNPRELSKG